MAKTEYEINNSFGNVDRNERFQKGLFCLSILAAFLFIVFHLFGSSLVRYGFRDAAIEDKLNANNVVELLSERHIMSIDNNFNGVTGYIEIKTNDKSFICDGFNFSNSYFIKEVDGKIQYTGIDLVKRGVSYQNLLDSINLNINCVDRVEQEDILKSKNRNTWKIRE